jgi:hypothetical protein
MLTIQNFTKLNNRTFYTASGEQQWVIMGVSEYPERYSFAVLPWIKHAYVIKEAITFQLDRIKKTDRGNHILTNAKNNNLVGIPKENLTLDNFYLELQIQTAVITNSKIYADN